MGFTNRLSIMAQAVAGFLGFGEVPTDPAAREAEVAALYDQARQEFPEVTVATAAAVLAGRGDVVLVDVRTPREREVSAVPGAVAAEVVEADPAAFADRHLVAYCTIGYRSGLWAQEWSKRGLRVDNLAGGVLAWSWAGGPFVHVGADGVEAPTTTVHVYGPAWDLLAGGYQSVW
jgi:sodium/bile acid cotransporter 7